MATKQAARVARMVRELTQPDFPTESATRRTVWGNAQECAHRWAANRHYSGRAGNVFFERATIYSYGGHFPMARHVKRGASRFILFTTRTYSVSTSGHLSDVQRAIPAGVPVYRVHNVVADLYREHLDNFRKLEADAVELAGKAKRARTHRAWFQVESAAKIRHANEYAAAVGLRERLEEVDPGKVAEWAAEALERAAAAKAKESKRAKAEAARLMAEWEQRLSAWRDGGEWPGNCPDPSHPLAKVAFLRVRGSRLETSLRAVVPLAAVLPVLEMVRKGEECDQNTIRTNPVVVDGFELREIDQSARRVVIGCHTVTFEEIERVASAAGL